MDIASSAVRDWGRLPHDILLMILDTLSEGLSWKNVAPAFSSVNKYWRDVTFDRVTVLKLKRSGGFQLLRDMKALSRMPHLHSITFTKFFFEQVQDETVELMRHSLEASLENHGAEGNQSIFFNKLHNLSIEDFEDHRRFISVFCSMVPSLKHLFIENGQLIKLPKEMAQLSQLQTLSLRKVDLISPGRCLDILILMKHLEALELSFINSTQLGSVAQLTRLQELNYLKIRLADFDFSKGRALSTLHHLSTLVLDGTVHGDDIDLSHLSQVVHLSITSLSMPCWITSMQSLQTLKLTTYDDFKYERRRQALLSVAASLQTLHLNAKKATQAFIDEVLLGSTNLEALSLTQHSINRVSLKGLHKVKEVVLHSIKDRSFFGTGGLAVVAEFPNLESVVLNTDHPLSRHNFIFLQNQTSITNTLTTLVLGNADDAVVELVIHHFPRLRDLRLLGTHVKERLFLEMSPSALSELKNLCVLVFDDDIDMITFLKLEFLTHLNHLAIPAYIICRWEDFLRDLKKRAPHLLIDDDSGGGDDTFKIRDPSKSPFQLCEVTKLSSTSYLPTEEVDFWEYYSPHDPF